MNYNVRYSIGLAFDESLKHIVLILKNKPAFLQGLWNAPGGKLEENETPLDCVVREYEEETGVIINSEQWIEIFDCKNDIMGYTLNVFFAKNDNIFKATTTTDEKIQIVKVDNLDMYQLAPNIRWMVPFCMTASKSFELPIKINDLGGD